MKTQSLSISDTPSSTLDFGIGFNWFDFLGSGGLYARNPDYSLSTQTYPALEDSADWSALLGEFDRLNPGFIRFGIPPDRILDGQGNLIRDSLHFTHLDRVAGWCAEHGATVILDPFVIPERFEFDPPAALVSHMTNMAARDNRAYAREFVAPLLQHVVVERGLSAIRYFNPVNEPIHYGVYQVPPGGPDVYRHYVDMYAEMRAALDDAGLRDIGLIGIDKDVPFDFPVFEYLARGIDIDPHVAAYAIHSYRGRFDYAPETALEPDTDPLRTLVDKWIRRLVSYTEGRGKPLLACEVGSFYYGQRINPAGAASAEATLLTAETILRMINVGVRGALIWSPLNPNNIDGWWRMFGVQGGQVTREPHTYPSFQLLMRYARPGSAVHPVASLNREYPQYVWGTLLHSPDGHRHLFLINDHPSESRCIELSLPRDPQGRRFRVIRKDRTRLGEVDGALFSTEHLEDTLAPMSMQLYTTDTVESCL